MRQERHQPVVDIKICELLVQRHPEIDRAVDSWLEFEAKLWRLNSLTEPGIESKDFVCWLETDLATLTPTTEVDQLEVVERDSVIGLPKAVEIPDRVPNDSLNLQMVISMNHKLLTADDEIFLGRTVQLGKLAQAVEESGWTSLNVRQAAIDSQAAVHDLVRYNQRLVVNIAKKQFQHWEGFLELTDLIQAGNLGLYLAAGRYDPESGNRFSTYATHWIRQRVTRSAQDTARLIRLPVSAQEELSVILRLQRELIAKEEPHDAQILARLTGFPESKVSQLLYYIDHAERVANIDMPIGEGDSNLSDLIESESEHPEDILAEKLIQDQVHEAIAKLPPREQLVIKRRFGLDGGEARSLREIGDEIGVTRERVRQIQDKALRRLNNFRHLLG
jgi:RNA polymerase sigma factor (sigma-70 family)